LGDRREPIFARALNVRPDTVRARTLDDLTEET
jgi:hypothetical protein